MASSDNYENPWPSILSNILSEEKRDVRNYRRVPTLCNDVYLAQCCLCELVFIKRNIRRHFNIHHKKKRAKMSRSKNTNYSSEIHKIKMKSITLVSEPTKKELVDIGNVKKPVKQCNGKEKTKNKNVSNTGKFTLKRKSTTKLKRLKNKKLKHSVKQKPEELQVKSESTASNILLDSKTNLIKENLKEINLNIEKENLTNNYSPDLPILSRGSNCNTINNQEVIVYSRMKTIGVDEKNGCTIFTDEFNNSIIIDNDKDDSEDVDCYESSVSNDSAYYSLPNNVPITSYNNNKVGKTTAFNEASVAPPLVTSHFHNNDNNVISINNASLYHNQLNNSKRPIIPSTKTVVSNRTNHLKETVESQTIRSCNNMSTNSNALSAKTNIRHRFYVSGHGNKEVLKCFLPKSNSNSNNDTVKSDMTNVNKLLGRNFEKINDDNIDYDSFVSSIIQNSVKSCLSGYSSELAKQRMIDRRTNKARNLSMGRFSQMYLGQVKFNKNEFSCIDVSSCQFGPILMPIKYSWTNSTTDRTNICMLPKSTEFSKSLSSISQNYVNSSTTPSTTLSSAAALGLHQFESNNNYHHRYSHQCPPPPHQYQRSQQQPPQHYQVKRPHTVSMAPLVQQKIQSTQLMDHSNNIPLTRTYITPNDSSPLESSQQYITDNNLLLSSYTIENFPGNIKSNNNSGCGTSTVASSFATLPKSYSISRNLSYTPSSTVLDIKHNNNNNTHNPNVHLSNHYQLPLTSTSSFSTTPIPTSIGGNSLKKNYTISAYSNMNNSYNINNNIITTSTITPITTVNAAVTTPASSGTTTISTMGNASITAATIVNTTAAGVNNGSFVNYQIHDQNQMSFQQRLLECGVISQRDIARSQRIMALGSNVYSNPNVSITCRKNGKYHFVRQNQVLNGKCGTTGAMPIPTQTSSISNCSMTYSNSIGMTRNQRSMNDGGGSNIQNQKQNGPISSVPILLSSSSHPVGVESGMVVTGGNKINSSEVAAINLQQRPQQQYRIMQQRHSASNHHNQSVSANRALQLPLPPSQQQQQSPNMYCSYPSTISSSPALSYLPIIPSNSCSKSLPMQGGSISAHQINSSMCGNTSSISISNGNINNNNSSSCISSGSGISSCISSGSGNSSHSSNSSINNCINNITTNKCLQQQQQQQQHLSVHLMQKNQYCQHTLESRANHVMFNPVSALQVEPKSLPKHSVSKASYINNNP